MNHLLASFLTGLFLFNCAGAALPSFESPAQRRVVQARKEIEKSPRRYQSYNLLAAALLERSLETDDPSFRLQAGDAIAKSLAIEKENYDAQKTLAGLLLSSGEFARAKDLAQALHKRNMDDLQVYGLMADAAIELGDYKEAEEAAQWMLDLRPADPRGLERGARLRELFGDSDGATQLWVAAFRQSPEAETGQRAAVLTGNARLQLSNGKFEAAQKSIADALKIFPGFRPALLVQANVNVAQKRYSEAIELLEKDPHLNLADLYTLADAFEKDNRQAAATPAWAEFERQALAAANQPSNANRLLVLYYADHAGKPAEALRIARIEAARRHDVFTMDSLAWALHVNGDKAEARKQMDKVLAVGIRDPLILAHAHALA